MQRCNEWYRVHFMLGLSKMRWTIIRMPILKQKLQIDSHQPLHATLKSHAWIQGLMQRLLNCLFNWIQLCKWCQCLQDLRDQFWYLISYNYLKHMLTGEIPNSPYTYIDTLGILLRIDTISMFKLLNFTSIIAIWISKFTCY